MLATAAQGWLSSPFAGLLVEIVARLRRAEMQLAQREFEVVDLQEREATNQLSKICPHRDVMLNMDGRMSRFARPVSALD